MMISLTSELTISRERTADNNTDGKIHDVTARDKCLEFVEHCEVSLSPFDVNAIGPGPDA